MSTRMRRRITSAKREEIEAEQRVIEETIVRPFETIEGLPISYNEPPNGRYEDVLKNPLTIKDSAVLYNSLIRSRNTFIYHAPMFQLHWVKQTAYAKKLAEMDKEKQKEVMRERENKRRFAKATTNSLEVRTRTPVLSPEVNARDVMSKLCESSITLGPHRMDIRIFIAKDSRSDKSRAFSELSKLGGAKQVTAESNNAKTRPPEDVFSSSSEVFQQHITPEPGPQPSNCRGFDDHVIQEKEPGSFMSMPAADSKLQFEDSKAPTRLSEKPGTDVSTIHKNPDQPTGAACTPVRFPRTKTVDVHSSYSSGTPNDDNQLPKDIRGVNGNPQTAFEIQCSGQSHVDEINERHTSKRSELRLNTSRPIPTEDRTDSRIEDQVEKQLKISSISKIPQISADRSVETNVKKSPAKVSYSDKSNSSKNREISTARSAPANLQSIENTIMISNLNAIAKIDLSLNDLMKEVASGKASETQITRFKKYIERAKQMGPQPHHAELFYSRGLPLPADFPRPYLMRPIAERKVQPKSKIHNPMKLTAFQEKYLHNATLVFEFLENPNVRYIIPQNSICEVLRPELSSPAGAEEGAEFNDILLSHMWIHNSDEMENYERAYAAYTSEVENQKKEEINAKIVVNEDSINMVVDPEGTPSRYRALRIQKKAPTRKRTQISPPDMPHVRYTTFSFTIHNVPSRYIPIFINSMKPCEEVRERMMHILKTGTRMASFYLWYQVDARLDEEFAEDSRNDAVAEERKMTGVLPPIEQKKRKPRDYKTLKAKRQKGDDQVIENSQLREATCGKNINGSERHMVGLGNPASVDQPQQHPYKVLTESDVQPST